TPKAVESTAAAEKARAAEEAAAQAELKRQAQEQSRAAGKPKAIAKAKNPPGLAPIPGPPLPISAAKQERLSELLRRYQADEVTPEQYTPDGTKILAELWGNSPPVRTHPRWRRARQIVIGAGPTVMTTGPKTELVLDKLFLPVWAKDPATAKYAKYE